jgi:glycosyltransferase involved in cell wall biosynthesis
VRRICLFNFPEIGDFHGYQIGTLDPSKYFPAHKTSGDFREFLSGGWNSYYVKNKLYFAGEIDKLYRNRDPAYMAFIADFVEQFRDFDVVILFNYCPIHPEVICHELKKPVKILGFVDDPFSTYFRGIPFLWAFDGAIYISPSYSENELFTEKLEKWGCTKHTWWPLVPDRFPQFEPTGEFFSKRDVDLVYVGNVYGPKVDRLVQLKKKFGNRFRVHGRWPFRGYHGIARAMLGKPVFWWRVTPLTNDERMQLYCRAKIGINMHLSDVPRETGNVRMYEVPAHGMMLMCDKAGRDAHAQIFKPDAEAIFYDSIEDAIEKIEYFLAHDAERTQIAKAGFMRARADYDWEQNLKRLLDWAWSLKSIKTSVSSTISSSMTPAKGGTA